MTYEGTGAAQTRVRVALLLFSPAKSPYFSNMLVPNVICALPEPLKKARLKGRARRSRKRWAMLWWVFIGTCRPARMPCRSTTSDEPCCVGILGRKTVPSPTY